MHGCVGNCCMENWGRESECPWRLRVIREFGEDMNSYVHIYSNEVCVGNSFSCVNACYCPPSHCVAWACVCAGVHLRVLVCAA
jgi:hypothetical protein